MHVISRRKLMEFAQRHPDALGALDAWYRMAARARWRSIRELRDVQPAADGVMVGSGNTVTVFNIGGNKYRLLAAIYYNRGRLFVLDILTHKDYDAGRWKENL